jgi:hypothetical protein
MKTNGLVFPLASFLLLACGIPTLHAQTVFSGREILAKDRPEAWVMKLLGSELQLTPMGVAGAIKPRSVEFGVDAGWLPSLDDRQRLIGFNGVKREDVNRSPAFARPRAVIGLPAQLSLDLGYIPPVRAGGIRANLFSGSLGRPLVAGARWRLSGRIHGQLGSLSGDITCDAHTVAAGQDPVLNPYKCEAPSKDSMRMRGIGVELGSAFKISPRLEPYIAPGWNYFANRFQVDAHYSGIIDRALLITSGPTFSLTAGVASRLSPKIRIAAEGLYVPLTVKRNGNRVRDGAFNLRASVFYSIR